MNLFKESKRARTIRAYREIFNTESGKEVLRDLCKSCHIFTTTMDVNANETAYREGERSVVLRIIKTLNIDPLEYDRLMKRGQSSEE
jgi:hypothetical protein